MTPSSFCLLSLILLCGCVTIYNKANRDSMVREFSFPEITHLPNNLPNDKRIELGRHLFYDPILSVDSTISCASCHDQQKAFADDIPISPGVNMRLANRNAPTLTNVAYNPTVLFDGHLTSLEMQVLVPLEEHAEMDHNIVLVAERLNKIPFYVTLSNQAYGRNPDPFVITRSIALFERTMISSNAKFDQFLRGEVQLTRDERKGMDLFMNQLNCVQCHAGYNFTDFRVVNNGLQPNQVDSGRMRVTKMEVDRDLFKVPTLRNIEYTAPYMHDGRFENLDQVIEHYASGGSLHPNKHQLIQPFKITLKQKLQLIAFLKTLSDEVFLSDKKLGPPNNRKP